MSRANKTRQIEQHETCKCKCRLDAGVCNNKQRWNDVKCRCECKELINQGVCDKGFIWNLLIASANVINHVILMSIQTMKTVNVEKR